MQEQKFEKQYAPQATQTEEEIALEKFLYWASR
jgi:hypothetical protein